MFYFAPDLANWTVVRLLDSAARGDDMPGWADEVGWLFIFLAGLVALVATVESVSRRLYERRQPKQEAAEGEKPWWATKAQTVEVEAPPRMRHPSLIALQGGVYHGQPVSDPDETQTFDAVSSTTVIERVRPARYKGGRRG